MRVCLFARATDPPRRPRGRVCPPSGPPRAHRSVRPRPLDPFALPPVLSLRSVRRLLLLLPCSVTRADPVRFGACPTPGPPAAPTFAPLLKPAHRPPRPPVQVALALSPYRPRPRLDNHPLYLSSLSKRRCTLARPPHSPYRHAARCLSRPRPPTRHPPLALPGQDPDASALPRRPPVCRPDPPPLPACFPILLIDALSLLSSFCPACVRTLRAPFCSFRRRSNAPERARRTSAW